jgi:hypothetical protein
MPTSGSSSETVTGGEYFYDSGSTGDYSNDESGTITFTCAEGSVIQVTFSSFELDEKGKDSYDYLEIYDGGSTSDEVLGTYYGWSSLDEVTSSGTSITFYFNSNKISTESGWKATIEVIDEDDVTYCDSYGKYSPIIITSVDFDGNVFANSSYSSYEDNTDSPITVESGSTYILSVTATSGGGTTYVRAWFDWDKDGVFSDDELYELGSISSGNMSGATVSSSIVIPDDATIGSIGMRISAEENGYPSSCDVNFDGEVEDYTLNITSDVPSVSLSVVSTSIDEDGGSTTMSVSLDEVCAEDVVVVLSVGGDVSTSDYSISSLSVTIPAGSTNVSVTFEAVNDDEDEGDEDATIEITSVTSVNSLASEAGTQEVSITIVDDDDPSTESIEVDDQSPENTYTAEELVENVLVTGCLTASNITYSGDETNGLGYFNQGDSDFPLSSGIIISTGYVNNAEGPNGSSYSDNASDNIGGTSDDVDAEVLTSFYGQDVQILEFDFVPAGDELEFNYIFASEEYPEYVGYGFNDVFAFILSGPGIDGDYQDDGENIALIPGTSEEVAINSVNSGSNSDYYVDESSGYATVFDGRTTVLTASATVQACETYHIRLIIADVGDSQYNSAVFLEANSFSSNEVEVDNMIGSIEEDQDVMYEGCDGSFMRFNRAEDYDIDEEIEFALNIAGTASNESGSSQDYIYVDSNGDMIDDGIFPTTITIPAGDEYADYYYEAVADDEVEDDETIIFRIDRCPCDESEYYEKTVTIINSPDVEAVASAAIQCEESGYPTVTISVQLVDGISSADYLYSYDGGVSFSSDNVYTITSTVADGSDLVGTTFYIVVTDLFSCSDNTINLETTIPEIESISADAGSDDSVCFGNGVQIIGEGGIYYEWTCTTPGIVDAYLSDANVSNPWVSEDIPVGSYEFILLVQDQEGSDPVCADQDTMILKVLETPELTSVYAGDYTLCSGEETSLGADVSMSVSYKWNPSSGLDDETSSNPVFSADVSTEESRSITLTVTASNGCTAVQSLDEAITVYPNPSVSIGTSSVLCSDGTNGELHIDVTGGTPNDSSPEYTYEWSHDASLDSPDLTSLDGGDYTLTVTDSKSCSVVESYTISSSPTATAGGSTTICPSGSATVTGASASDGTIVWTHDGGGSLEDVTTLTPTYNAVASDLGNIVTLTMTVTGEDSCDGESVSAKYTIDVVDDDAPVADATSLSEVTAQCEVTSLTAPTATDACAGSITGTTTTTLPITGEGSTTVTWTYDDGNGNTSTQTQTVTVSDSEKPSLDALTDMSVVVCADEGTEGDSPQTATVDDLSLSEDLYEDNCTSDEDLIIQYRIRFKADESSDYTTVVSFSDSDSDVSGYAFPVGISQVTYRVTDAAGNRKAQSFTVTVNALPNPSNINF